MGRRTYVWDRFVRLFHWSLVVAFTVAYLTGEEDTDWHFYVGYFIGALIVARVVWGFIGTRYARFNEFITPPGAAVAYLRSLSRGPVQHFQGHNPAGAWMVILLLASIALTVGTGLRVYDLEGHGPFAVTKLPKPNIETMGEPAILALRAARKTRHDQEEFWEEVHEIGANLCLGLIVLHLLGVFVSSLRHRENLVRAMVIGYKDTPDQPT